MPSLAAQYTPAGRNLLGGRGQVGQDARPIWEAWPKTWWTGSGAWGADNVAARSNYGIPGTLAKIEHLMGKLPNVGTPFGSITDIFGNTFIVPVNGYEWGAFVDKSSQSSTHPYAAARKAAELARQEIWHANDLERGARELEKHNGPFVDLGFNGPPLTRCLPDGRVQIWTGQGQSWIDGDLGNPLVDTLVEVADANMESLRKIGFEPLEGGRKFYLWLRVDRWSRIGFLRGFRGTFPPAPSAASGVIIELVWKTLLGLVAGVAGGPVGVVVEGGNLISDFITGGQKAADEAAVLLGTVIDLETKARGQLGEGRDVRDAAQLDNLGGGIPNAPAAPAPPAVIVVEKKASVLPWALGVIAVVLVVAALAVSTKGGSSS